MLHRLERRSQAGKVSDEDEDEIAVPPVPGYEAQRMMMMMMMMDAMKSWLCHRLRRQGRLCVVEVYSHTYTVTEWPG